MVHNGVRVGLLGALGTLVIAFLSLVPVVGTCLVWMFNVLLWVGLGVLVAYWRSPEAEESHVALAGALAGGIAALVGGLVGILLAPVALALVGGTAGALRLLPPFLLEAYRSAGIAPEVVFSPTGMLLIMSFSCGLQVLLAPVTTAFVAVVADRWWGEDAWDLWEEEPGPYMLEW